MGFFESLEIEEYDREYGDRALLRRMAAYFKPHKRTLGLVLASLVLLSFTGAAMPIVVARGVDVLASQMHTHASQSAVQSIILILFAIIVTAGVLDWGGNWFRRRWVARIVADVVLAMRMDAFRAALGQDLSFYDKFSSGRIVSRITSDTREFGQVVIIITDFITEISQAFILIIVLFQVDWRLSLLVLCFLPPLFFLARSYRNLARRITQRGMRAMGNVNAAIKETVSGIAIAKNFRQEEGIYADFEAANKVSYRVNLRRGLILALVYPTLNALAGAVTGLVVYAGGFQSLQGILSAGSFYLFLLSLDRFWFPVLEVTGFWAQIQSGLSCAERVFALVDTKTDIVQSGNRPAPRAQAAIDFIDVNFRYTTREAVLENFNLHITPGENIAIVGHTGAGKSSIVKLIARFYEFQGGQILIDGQDIRAYNLNGYRRKLGIISQNPFLFSGSVLDNIRYARPEAPQGEIVDIVKQIGDGEWLETLPQGLQSEVGERGVHLSMGQRQLVALFRVLIQKPAIFILDEATASIDPFTEWQIQQAILLILKNTTSILIAHRLSTVTAADRIVVLDNGRIIEEGSHRSLISQAGHYALLYNTYFRHQSLSYIEKGRKDIP